MKRFENIKIGDQLELPAKRHLLHRDDDTRNPDRPVDAVVVTHRWYDPVERKEYVALARILAGGPEEHPREKRTITGLARAGWQWASKDWLAHAKALNSPNVRKLQRKHKPTVPRIYR